MVKKKGKKRYYGKRKTTIRKSERKQLTSYIKAEKKRLNKKNKKNITKLIHKEGTGCSHIWDELNNDTMCKLFTERNGKRHNWEKTEKLFTNETCATCVSVQGASDYS